jgi:hypothetical protein
MADAYGSEPYGLLARGGSNPPICTHALVAELAYAIA